MRAETRPHEAGFGSNRVSEGRGEYVPAPCTHRPSKHPSEVRMRPGYPGRIWASQGGLSRNKVAVGESAAGSPPNDRDQADAPDPPYHSSVRDRHSFEGPIGHFRTTKANAPRKGRAHSSVGECLLCKEDALGSNPSGSIVWLRSKPCSLSGTRYNDCIPNDRCTTPRESEGGKG